MGSIFLSFERWVDQFQKHGHRHRGFTPKWASKVFELLTSINLSLSVEKKERCHRLAFSLRVWIKVLVAPWPCKYLNKGDLKLRFTPWLKRTCKLQKQSQGKLNNAGSKINIIQGRYPKSFLLPSFASISIRNFKYSNYNIRIALRYLIPSSLLATWPDAAPYTGNSCLSPSSRFSLALCSFHPSPAGAPNRASRNTSFKLCYFVNGAHTHTHTLRHETPHLKGAITRRQWRITGTWILECKKGKNNACAAFKRAVLYCCI